ncbi:MAG: carboxypeptidase-like regulatory domain-containing protein [Bacteroidales bacterium]|nr:carboxypeptidase-like regulatory domain-containing protein [Bacteroidales bacterium]
MKPCFRLVFTLSTIICICVFSRVMGQEITGYVYDCRSRQPVENASVYFKNSNRGTTTLKSGFFALKTAGIQDEYALIISHISYNKAVLDKNTAESGDTLNICLEPRLFNLDEAVISARKRSTIGRHNLSVIDFDFINENVLLLIRDHTNHRTELVLTNPVFDTIAILSTEDLNGAGSIEKDCLGYCHLLFKDYAIQIWNHDSTLSLSHKVSGEEFEAVDERCLFKTEEYLVFGYSSKEGFSNEFYAVNTRDQTTRIVYSGIQSEKLRKLNAQISFIMSHPDLYSDVSAAIHFEQKIMYRPSVVTMHKVGDTVYLFDYANDRIDLYSGSLEYVRSIQIGYHSDRNWNNKTIIDQVEGKAYTTITENNLEILYLIDLTDGNIERKATIPYVYPFKTMVNSGYVYVLFKGTMNQPVSKRLFKLKL